MTQHLKNFVFGAVAFWTVVAYPALRIGGSEVFAYTLVSLGLCAVPTAGLLCWRAGLRQRPENSRRDRPMALLAGTGIRLTVVLAGALTLYAKVPYFQRSVFWICLLVFYLYLLGLEIYLLVAEQEAPAGEDRGLPLAMTPRGPNVR